MSENQPQTPEANPNNGARNLTIFGIVAVVLAIITSGISLVVYHTTGDIYLDRSRPGFMPEEGDDTSSSGETSPEAIFPSEGALTEKDLETYLKNLDALTRDITAEPDAFSGDALTDDSLNITGTPGPAEK